MTSSPNYPGKFRNHPRRKVTRWQAMKAARRAALGLAPGVSKRKELWHPGENRVRVSVPAGQPSSRLTRTIYWLAYDKIQRANLSENAPQDLVSGLDGPEGIALDATNHKIYWTVPGYPPMIQKANFDGSERETLALFRPPSVPTRIALEASSGKLYWSDAGLRAIRRANLDGSDLEDIVMLSSGCPAGIALDASRGKLYWTVLGDSPAILRSGVDGSRVEKIVTSGLSFPVGIALDTSDNRLYWTDASMSRPGISRANLNGTDVEALVSKLDGPPFDITLDIANGNMYWAEIFGDVCRANLDGSNAETLLSGLNGPGGLELL